MEARIGEFQGKPMFQIWDTGKPSEKPVFAMGMRKAKLIVDAVDKLKNFVASEGKSI